MYDGIPRIACPGADFASTGARGRYALQDDEADDDDTVQWVADSRQRSGLTQRGAMANIPRQHHYVPQVLLAGFTANGTKTGRLHILDLVRRKTYPSTPQETAKEKDYNMIEVEGVDPLAIENGLLATEIEGPAGPALQKVRRGGVPNDDDRVRLLSLMAMQDLRGPSRREAFDDFMTGAMRGMVAALTSSEEIFEAQKREHPELGGISREEALDWARHTKVENSPTGHLQAQLPSFGPILELLGQRSWTVLIAPKGTDFVCTDNPVAIIPAGTRPVEAPRGFASADAPVVMPVGRHHALLGTWPLGGDEPTWHGMNTDVRTVAIMNTCIIFRAHRFIASPTEDVTWLRGNGTIGDRAALVELLDEQARARNSGV